MALSALTYAERLEIALTMLTDYERDEADFTTYNAVRFTTAWKTDWLAAIHDARDVSSDDDVVDEGTDRTARQQDMMEAARQNYQRFIKPFIEDAFLVSKPGLMNAFGVNNYDAARNSVTRMIMFLGNLKVRCAEHSAELSAVGMHTDKMTLITTHLTELENLSRAQNDFSGTRHLATAERVRLFDVMDSFTKETARAGKNIYYSAEHPRYLRYVVYGSSAPSTVDDTFTVPANDSIFLFAGKLSSNSGFRFSNQGPNKVAVFVGNDRKAELPNNALYIAADEGNVRALANELLANAGVYGGLVVHNDGNSPVTITIQLLKVVEDN